MSVQTPTVPHAQTAGASLFGSAGKAAKKPGGFQSLLSTLLSAMKKPQAGSADEAKKALKTQEKPSSNLNRKAPAAPQAREALAAQAPKAAQGVAALKPQSAEVKKTPEGAAEQKGPKKKALSEEIASSSRSHEAMAAALGNNAEFKAAKKDGDKVQEKDPLAKTSDAASAGKKKGRIDLIDSRKPERAATAGVEAAETVKSEKDQKNPRNESQLTIDLSPKDGQKPSGGEKAEGAGGQSFSARLASSLQNGYNDEIVKHSAVILRGDDSGLIRLNLKPESLGNVKVRLDLADNHISGTIIVESEAAKDAFEANIEHLTKSFIDSGFQDAKLQVSVDSGASGSGGGQARQDAPRDFSRAARALDAAVPQVQGGGSGNYRARSGGLSVFA
jgi:flagellar hook-length control protein FliK